MNKVAPVIRPAARADIAAIIEIFRASVRQVAIHDYTAAQLMAWAPGEIDPAVWAGRYDARYAWVAEVGSAVAGFCELENDGHLDMLYVHPGFQRRGVASALLERAQSAAHGLGLHRLHTESSITARGFFERRRFRLITITTVALRGQDLVSFRMEKRLDQDE